MKASLLLSIRPKWVAKILNGEKTIEVRKQFPKDYVGWVYIYCTKDNSKENDGNVIGRVYPMDIALKVIIGKGKVVARFWCDKVEKIEVDTYRTDDTYMFGHDYYTSLMNEDELLIKSCLMGLESYLKGCNGYAIHISKLETYDKFANLKIFDKPLELTDFYRRKQGLGLVKLTKAPQNYCYVVSFFDCL